MKQLTEQFERRKKLSIYWYNKASDLRGSAGVLWYNMHASDAKERAEKLGLGHDYSFSVACRLPYEMLSGMALELLLKAVIVGQGKEPKSVHTLGSLSKQAALTYSVKQLGLLGILSEAIIWQGRYPAPKSEQYFHKANEARSEHLFDQVPQGKLKIFKPNTNLDWKSFDELWSVAFDEYAKNNFQNTYHL